MIHGKEVFMSLKKDLFIAINSMLFIFIMLFAVGPKRQIEAAPLQVTPTPRPGYYKGSFESSDEFVNWMKSPEALTQNDGAYKRLIDSNNEYGYILVPSYANTNPSVNYDTDGNVEYCLKIDNRYIYVKAWSLPTDEKKQYAAKGISQYIKDAWSISDFNNEIEITKYSPDYPYIKYLFSEGKVDVAGENIDCIICRITSLVTNLADAKPTVSYKTEFIYDGMVISVGNYGSENEAAFYDIVKQLKFTEVIMNQDNYNNTKAVITKIINDSRVDKNNQDKNIGENIDENIDKTTDKNKGDSYIKIQGKKKVKCGKSYTYKIKSRGLEKKVKWSVSNKKLAKVSKSGKLKAKRKGTVKLTAKSGKVKCSIKIKIV